MQDKDSTAACGDEGASLGDPETMGEGHLRPLEISALHEAQAKGFCGPCRTLTRYFAPR